MTSHIGNIDDLNTWCWAQLRRAAHDRHSEFRWLNIATVDATGAPQVRTVVLRDVDQNTRRVTFHTDRRSRKLAELSTQNTVALHFHSRRHAIQMRFAGLARSSSEHDRSAAWLQLYENAKATYSQMMPSGSRLDPRDKNALDGPCNTTDGYSNFVVIDVSVSSIDWLELDTRGHRRALLTYRPSGGLEGAWVAP